MKSFTLITGASSGIGLELAKLAADDGHNLLIVAKDKAKLQKITKELNANYPVETASLALDLSVPSSAQFVYDWAVSHGQVDILINNAGFGDYDSLVEADWSKLEDMINLNILTLSKLTRLLAPKMVKRGSGRIMNVASTAAFLPGPLMATYYATKAYVKSFSVALAEELSGSGVTVTTLCPGATKTHFEKSANLEKSKLFKGHLASAQEVAQFGYVSMMKGRGLVVHGAQNRIMVLAIRLAPASFAARLAKKAQSQE